MRPRLQKWGVCCVLTAFSISVSVLSSKLHNRDDTPKAFRQYSHTITHKIDVHYQQYTTEQTPITSQKTHVHYGTLDIPQLN